MNSFGAYVASAATVSVPLDLMCRGTWAAIELTAPDGLAGAVVLPAKLLLLLQAAAPRIVTTIAMPAAHDVRIG